MVAMNCLYGSLADPKPRCYLERLVPGTGAATADTDGIVEPLSKRCSSLISLEKVRSVYSGVRYDP
jgi:hypothetical protein